MIGKRQYRIATVLDNLKRLMEIIKLETIGFGKCVREDVALNYRHQQLFREL